MGPRKLRPYNWEYLIWGHYIRHLLYYFLWWQMQRLYRPLCYAPSRTQLSPQRGRWIRVSGALCRIRPHCVCPPPSVLESNWIQLEESWFLINLGIHIIDWTDLHGGILIHISSFWGIDPPLVSSSSFSPISGTGTESEATTRWLCECAAQGGTIGYTLKENILVSAFNCC